MLENHSGGRIHRIDEGDAEFVVFLFNRASTIKSRPLLLSLSVFTLDVEKKSQGFLTEKHTVSV